MKIYVAGSSLEVRERVIPAMRALKAGGVLITQDWTKDVLIARAEGLADADLLVHQKRELAEACLAGVEEANAVLLLVPNEGAASIGAWIEVGYAFARCAPVIMTGPKAHASIFSSKADSVFTTDEAGVEQILGWMPRRSR